MQRKILLIYTGGTIGMINDPKSGVLKPFDFAHLMDEIPELKRLDCIIETESFQEPIDSSNMTPDTWVKLVKMIERNYEKYDGFVILHGTDTMAFTASAVSYMIENLKKPIVFTGSQLPIGIIRTDGKENLITAIEIASAYAGEFPLIPEVSVYFEYKLYRGNRTTKLSANHFNAFESFNFPILAEAGIEIAYNLDDVLPFPEGETVFRYGIENDIFILKLYPGISKKLVHHFFNAPEIKGVVLETFGAGNATSYEWFLGELREAIAKGVIIVNVTQCKMGSVNQSKYETGKGLEEIGLISAGDMTSEAAITKLMYLLGNYERNESIKTLFQQNLVGEIS
ncbi:asparaginase [Parvicella tangerina]|uniref:asparaginase n=1 Tax=Parvicella tangerina TaxID=2829795 RepID=A0A916JL40_9FLAO|nr:asparaginase [Parvicella tangerina]CAG5078674.1 L-asparaginase 1 [Parvicella tangerina]